MMKKSQLNWAGRCFVPAIKSLKSTMLLLCAAAALTARADADDRVPDLPPVCARIAAPEGNQVVFHVYAVGVQIYRWDGSAWTFVAPNAVLYADADHQAQVGTHFATPTGPAWESTSGSRVVEQRVDGCTPDSTAIQWLLLRTLSEEGAGVFSGVNYVQRVNTVGGLSPSTAGAFVGEEKQVPYTAEYFFYRPTTERYRQTNLVSDLPDVAQLQDINLVNAWGVSFGGAGPFWVNNNGTGKSTLYAVTNDANGAEIVTKQTLEVTIPGGAPTGVVSNNKGGFNGDVFLFASLDGTISGWRSALGTTAETLATRASAVYSGLALTTNSSGPLLLAANFAGGTLDAFGPSANLVAQFTDASAPAGYAPFNVQVVNGAVFVMFAKHEAGDGRGLIDVFEPETGAFHRFATGTDAGGKLAQINSPWGIALAPKTFGKHGGDLLVGNFGSGTIMTFGLDGKFHGLLKGLDGGAIEIERLWGLTFGNGGRAGSPDALFFAAGPVAETHGLFGNLKPAAETESHE
ncbi:MAG: TIGR03118 family protein [Verrucomicrobia bacterium]|nr:TIGR03118 family protein [Verrucomicrobiota bacterium]